MSAELAEFFDCLYFMAQSPQDSERRRESNREVNAFCYCSALLRRIFAKSAMYKFMCKPFERPGCFDKPAEDVLNFSKH